MRTRSFVAPYPAIPRAAIPRAKAGISSVLVFTRAVTAPQSLRFVLLTNQRVPHFTNFVNGPTGAYDDWRDGTHVSGVNRTTATPTAMLRGGLQ